MRASTVVAVALALTASAAGAQLAELFSRHVRIENPQGEFPAALIRLQPAAGDTWREVRDEKSGYRIQVPADAAVDPAPKDSRVLQVTFAAKGPTPRPVFRVDVFQPQPGEPTEVDAEYAKEYAEQYPQAAFGGKFTVTDSGLVILPKKTAFAMVGGGFMQRGERWYRMQWTHLNKERQYFLTFDCAEPDWPRHAEAVGRMLLSFERLK